VDSTLVLVPPLEGPATDDTQPSPPTPAVIPDARPPRVVRLLAFVLPFVLAGYALFDRAYAWLHLPGVPLFQGELVIALALFVIAGATHLMIPGLRSRVPSALLLAFVGWGVLRTLPYLGTHKIDAVRDAALWYYSVIAIAVAGLVVTMPHLPKLWAGSYRRLVPWLLLWSFPAIQLDARPAGPYIPDAPVVSWFAHKSGNVAVGAAMALAFLWLVPVEGLRRQTRVLLSALVSLLIAMTATQSRSGLIAAGAGIAVTWLMSDRRRTMLAVMLTPVVLMVGLAWAIDFKIPAHPRPISVTQLAKNLASLTGGGSSELSDTAQWRDDLWTSLLKETRQYNKLMTGWGFGPNLAERMGFEGERTEGPLRSPHNSHLDILARMGVVGVMIWGALWVSWFATMIRARQRLRALSNRFTHGVIGFCIASVVAILVNAYFDPTVESPQVAMWLWTLFGLGLGLVARERLTRETRAPLPAH
jgi:hypothetical protein